MPQFMLAYHGGGEPSSPEEGKALVEQWKAWLENLGAAVVNPGTPLGKSKTLSKSGVEDHGGANPLMGFTVLEAADMDAALALARDCPHLEVGTIELAEMKSMS